MKPTMTEEKRILTLEEKVARLQFDVYALQNKMADRKTEPQMRDATAEERQSVRNYIKSIEKDTGVRFFETEPQTETPTGTDCSWK